MPVFRKGADARAIENNGTMHCQPGKSAVVNREYRNNRAVRNVGSTAEAPARKLLGPQAAILQEVPSKRA